MGILIPPPPPNTNTKENKIMNHRLNYLKNFVSIVMITHLCVLAVFGLLAYFVGLPQAIDNIGGWYETKASGEVYYHAYNFLHFMALTYLPAMVLAPFITAIDWINDAPARRKLKRTPNTITGKELVDIKL